MIPASDEKAPPIAWENLMRERMGRRVRDFRVIEEAEGLVLLGRTSSFYDKQMAQQVILEASEYRIVANRLIVEK